MVEQGQIGKANAYIDQLMKQGKLRITPQGSQAKHLPTGQEGAATIVYGAKDNPYISVRKAYDREGVLYSKKMLGEKHQMWRKAQRAGEKNLATNYSKRIRKGKGGTPFHILEYVQGTPTDSRPAESLTTLGFPKIGPNTFRTRHSLVQFKKNPNARPPVDPPERTTLGRFGQQLRSAVGMRSKAQKRRDAREMFAADILGNPDNAIIDRKTGVRKAIDFIPVKRLTALTAQLDSGKNMTALRKLQNRADRKGLTGDLYHRERAARVGDKYGIQVGTDRLKKQLMEDPKTRRLRTLKGL